jgi:hypothetical protein
VPITVLAEVDARSTVRRARHQLPPWPGGHGRSPETYFFSAAAGMRRSRPMRTDSTSPRRHPLDHQQERGHDFWVMRDPWQNEFCVLQTEFPDLLGAATTVADVAGRLTQLPGSHYRAGLDLALGTGLDHARRGRDA